MLKLRFNIAPDYCTISIITFSGGSPPPFLFLLRLIFSQKRGGRLTLKIDAEIDETVS